MSNQPEALRLADELVAPVGTQSTYSVMQQAAAELRRLHALAMDQQGEIYGLTFARETERKIHNLVKAECDALRARLAEPEPVALKWIDWWRDHGQHNLRATSQMTFDRATALMKLAFEVGREAAPPARAALKETK